MVMPIEQRAKLKNNPQALAAYEGALDATKFETASQLKRFKSGVAAVMGVEPEKLTDETIAGIANSFVETGTFAVGDKQYTRESLLEAAKKKTGAAKDFARELPYTAALLGEAPDPETLIPKQEELNRPAQRISEAVNENNGWLSKIWFAIQGFFNWIVDLFNGGGSKGLGEHINMVAASTIAQSTHNKLAADMNKDPALAHAIGGAEGLRRITDQVYNTTMDVAAGKSTKPTESLADRLAQVEEVTQTPPAKWNDAQVAAASAEVKTKVSSLVQDRVNDAFDLKKNPKLWEELATETKKATSEKSSKNLDGGVISSRVSNFFTSASTVRNTVMTAIGGKPENAPKLLGDAVSEGVMQTFKGLSAEEINAALSNPETQAAGLAKKIADRTFETRDWKTIEENVKKSGQSEEQQTKILATMKAAVTTNVEAMIKDQSGAIKQAASVKDGLLQVQERVKGLNNLTQLDKDGNKALSYEEVRFLDRDGNQKLSSSELAALPDDLRKQFADIMAKPENQTLVKKTAPNEIDFSELNKIPGANKAGLSIN